MDSGDMEITDNTISDCGFAGLYMEVCENATLSGNVMSGSEYNFWLWGYRSINYHHTVDTTNTVDGKPIYYLRNVQGAVDLITGKPEDLELVLTGRGAPEEICEMADYVTEMTERKHPYQRGIKARKGVEY